MKKITPEHNLTSEFEGRLSDIISGVALLTRDIEPTRPDVGTLHCLYNYPIATRDTVSWIIKASLDDEDKSNRIGISTFQENIMICGKTFTSLTQQLKIFANNETDGATYKYKHNFTYDYGIQIKPKTRRVMQVIEDNRCYFDFKANPLTRRFGFSDNMTSFEVVDSFSRVVNAALRKELTIKDEY